MKRKALLCILLGCSLTMSAKVKLQPMFSDNMVLQQQTSAPIWGEAKPGKAVTITTSWDGSNYRVKADSKGQWKVNLATPKAGGPYDITISDGQKLTLHDVLIGEVWLCTGQSNMEMPMGGWDIKMNADEIAQSGKYKNIRLLQVDEVSSTRPKTTVTVKNNGWMQCSPETVRNFSATGYFFGKNLNEKENVPIGLIMTCWGGTPVESWISAETLGQRPSFRAKIDEVSKMPADNAALKRQYAADLKQWEKERSVETGSYDNNGNCVFARNSYDDNSWQDITMPNTIESQGIIFDGCIWFRKTVEIPAAWAGKALDLYVGQVDDNDVTYFNGVEVGRTDGWGTLRHYTVPAKLVKAGKAAITVRDLDNGGDGGIRGEAKDLKIGLKGSDAAISLAGTWKVKTTTDITKHPLPIDNSVIPKTSTALYNSMINPLIPYAIRGAIWYQGEENVPHAYQYRDLLPMMIEDWRSRWGYQFPFYIMQLANYKQQHDQPVESEWAELREAQLLTAKHVANTAMAVNIDIGMPNNIHPIKKYEVGRRLALLAEALTYNNKVQYSGPEYHAYKIEGDHIRLYFKHADGMKTTDGGQLTGFSIAGPDKKFYWADARIDGNSIVVSSKDVTCPLAVRYAWDDDPKCNLTNSSNLPASPFRTDDWQGLTFGKE